MKSTSTKAVLALATTAAMLSPAMAAITTESLLDQMTDLKRLAELPEPAYTTKQFSSWDRAAKSPTENWFANGDAGQFLRVEDNAGRKEYVMMDIDGPGAIVRLWSANPEGTIRVYLDGGEKPVIETPMKTLLEGKHPNLPRPIAGAYASGWNLYFPIPYAKHCKVTSDKGGFYYHVNYRTYAPGTKVETFSRQDLERMADKIKTVAEELDGGLRRTQGVPTKLDAFRETLAPDEEKTVSKLSGPRTIVILRMRLEAASIPAVARGVVMTIHFDGEETVSTPVGDFFASAPGLIPYKSLPFVNVEDTDGRTWGQSAWWMPFSKVAEIRLRNGSGQEVKVEGVIGSEAYQWTDRSLLFHAKWRIQRDIPTRPFIDWTHLECTGNGRFVGGMLHIINPVKGWWGEGDEKIYVDGETFPSTFGTGSEDYYGYAWGSSELYNHAYHNQTRCDGPGTYGNNSENRFHILDDIPFTRSFKFDMENWHSKEGITVTRAAVSYWYARPGGKDFFKPITKEDVRYTEVPPFVTTNTPGLIEGESLVGQVIQKSGGSVSAQELGEPYSGDRQLRWQATKVGDRLVLGFESQTAGPKHVLTRFKKAYDFAIVQVSINGQKASEPLDCYSKETTLSHEIDLGSFDLKAGRNDLTLEVTGVNPAAEPKLLVGLDFIRLK
jgi:hypothetical protein